MLFVFLRMFFEPLNNVKLSTNQADGCIVKLTDSSNTLFISSGGAPFSTRTALH